MADRKDEAPAARDEETSHTGTSDAEPHGVTKTPKEAQGRPRRTGDASDMPTQGDVGGQKGK